MNIKAHKTVTNELVDAIIESIIVRRAKGDRESFLKPPHPDSITFRQLFSDDLKSKKDLKSFFSILEKCKQDNKMIIVYGDYDADGVTATAIMWETLNSLGFKSFPFIPQRKDHGYGLSKKAIDEIKEKHNPGLIITVDNGISAHDEVAYAKKLGILVVVTDHHSHSHKELPHADIVFHAPSVSGSGLSYFLAREIVIHFGSGEERVNDHILLATIGSVADLVDLVGINRSVVYHGLKILLTTKRHGIRLMREDRNSFNVIDVGYSIAPKINVFGRIDDPMEALRLICTTDLERANDLFKKAVALTITRRKLVEAVTLKYDDLTINDAIVAIVSDTLDEGIIGLIASDCVKKFGKPALIICKSGQFYKGSMRSIPDVDSAKLLSNLHKYTESSGGHAMAGGFLLKKKNIENFLKQANTLVSQNEVVGKTYEIDVLLPADLTTLELVKQIQRLSPFGKGNEMPIFGSKIRIKKVIAMGKTKKHARIKVVGNSSDLDFVYFNGYDLVKDLVDCEIMATYTIEIDSWDGVEKVSRKVVSILTD